MTVLLLLTLALAGIISGVSRTSTLDRRHLEADNEARRVFDRMASDFARMFKRPDADNIFAAIPGTDSTHGANDKMFFYSEAPTYFDASAQSSPAPLQGTTGLIGYRVSNATSNSTHPWQLERLGKGLSWDGQASAPAPGGVVFLTYPAASPSPAATPTPFPASTLVGHWPATIGSVAASYDDGSDPTYYHVLSSYVFRLEFCFALKNQTATSQFITSVGQGKGFSNVSAIVVAIAILDPQGRAVLPSTASGQPPDLGKFAAALPDADFTTSPPGKLMAGVWNGKLQDGTFATAASVPQTLAAQVRVYQRYFYLNTRP